MAKGGPEHTGAQQLLASYFRRAGMVAVLEGYVGKHVDVLVYDPPTRQVIGVEYQTTGANVLRNILTDLQAGCHKVIVVSSSPIILQRIQWMAVRALSAKLYAMVEFRLLKDFVPEGEQKQPINVAEQNHLE